MDTSSPFCQKQHLLSEARLLVKAVAAHRALLLYITLHAATQPLWPWVIWKTQAYNFHILGFTITSNIWMHLPNKDHNFTLQELSRAQIL